MPAETARQVEPVDPAILDAVLGGGDAQPGDIGPLGLREGAGIRLGEGERRTVGGMGEGELRRSVGEAAQFVHPAGPKQFAQQVDEARAAHTLGRSVTDHGAGDGAIRPELHLLDCAGKAGHAAGNLAALEGRAGRAGGGEDPVPVAEDEFGVGADIHHGYEAILVRQVDGEHAGGRIGAHVAADDWQPVDPGLRVEVEAEVPRGRDQAGGAAPALRQLDLRDRVVGALADRMHGKPEEQVAHGRVARDHHLVD